MEFLNNTFAASDGVTLQAADASWAKITGGSATDMLHLSGRVYGNNANATYFNSADPPGADYEVSVTLNTIGGPISSDSTGPMVRCAGTALTGYWARYRFGTGYQLFRYNAGVATQLGTTVTAGAPVSGTPTVLTLRALGNVISVLRDGVQIISVTDATPITDVGKVGLLCSATPSSGYHVDALVAGTVEVVASVTPTGIASGEAFGASLVSTPGGPQSVVGVGIASTTAFGTTTVTPTIPQAWFDTVADGMWTWFSDPRAVYRNGATYIGWVNSAGTCGISKHVHATGVTTSFSLAVGLQVDDHNNTAIHFLPDGRIMAFFTMHNDDAGHRYRISTNPEDISAWGSTVVLSTGITRPVCYSHPFTLSQLPNRTWLFYRSGRSGGLPTPSGLGFKFTDNDGGSWADEQRVFATLTSSLTAYYKLCSNGVDTIHVVTTDLHPGQGQVSIYHMYMKLGPSNEIRWYRTDGTEITAAQPFLPSAGQLVYDGSAVRGWIWEIALDRLGRPRILGTRYPANNGTDIRYMHWLYDGQAWRQSEIVAGGSSLYPGEPYYSGGICFDAHNCDVIYMSQQVGSFWEIQEWGSADGGYTWAKVRDITPGAAQKNCRPYSPRNHDGRAAVVFWRGTYNTYISYNAAIKAAAGKRVEIALRDRSAALQANLDELEYVVLDADTPGEARAVLAAGSDGETDSAGVFRAAASGARRDAVFVAVSDTSGATGANSKAFAAPLPVL